jgi:hypothetical protein
LRGALIGFWGTEHGRYIEHEDIRVGGVVAHGHVRKKQVRGK